MAVDINTEMLDLARRKEYGACPVTLLQADAYRMPTPRHTLFTAGFHGFWWSHIPLQDSEMFLTSFHAALRPGALVVMVDNRYVDGSSTPLCRRDEHGNTYQTRQLQDGSSHEVLKNFPGVTELHALLGPHCSELEVRELKYYWIARYTTSVSRHDKVKHE